MTDIQTTIILSMFIIIITVIIIVNIILCYVPSIFICIVGGAIQMTA